MMISSECYYEEYLHGKSQEEILRQIRSLKKEINCLKRELEDDSLEPKSMIMPSPLTRIKVSREYLEIAKKAYREAGGEYVLTRAELQDQAFNDALQHMTRFIFDYGGFFGGYETRTYTVSGDKVLFDMVHSLYPKPSNLPIYEPFVREEFIQGIAELHIGEWKSHYINYNVLDGTQWSIDIEYDDDRRSVHIDGSNAFPYNFSGLLAFLEIDDEDGDEEDEIDEE